MTETTTRTIASTLADMLARAEELSRAHDALDLPSTDDVAVDWRAVIAQVDALGEASHQLMLLARDTMIPTLISVKTHAQTALAEIDDLNALAQASPTARSPHHTPKGARPMAQPASIPVPASWDAATTPPAILQAALRYVQHGWPLIDGLYGVGPRDPGWNQRPPITTEAQARSAFGSELRQVSLWTGIPGSNLVDVDLDSVEAVQLASHFLTRTEAIWGRLGNPLSHFLYQVTPSDAPTSIVRLTDPGQRVLLEVRGRASHGISTLPPSRHKSGETYRWYSEGQPAAITWDALVREGKTLAAAALLLRAYPKEAGGRNDFARHVAGMLAHAGWSEDRIVTFMRPIIETALDDDVDGRLRDAVRHTVQQHQSGKPVTGAPTLASLMGQANVDRVRELLALTSANVPVDQPEGGLVFERASDLLAQPDVTTRWVVEHQLPVGGLGLLVGYPKSGKSVTAQNLALAVARGESFLGRFPTTPGAVFYIAHEEHRDQTRRRWREMGATTEPVYFAFAPHLQSGLAKLKAAVNSAPERPGPGGGRSALQVRARQGRQRLRAGHGGPRAADGLHARDRARDPGAPSHGEGPARGRPGGARVDRDHRRRRHDVGPAAAYDRDRRRTVSDDPVHGAAVRPHVRRTRPRPRPRHVPIDRRGHARRDRARARRGADPRGPRPAARGDAPGGDRGGGGRADGARAAPDQGHGRARRAPPGRRASPRGADQAEAVPPGPLYGVRAGGIPASRVGEQASGSDAGGGTSDGCSLPSVLAGNNREADLFPLARSASTLVPTGVPPREQPCGPEQAPEEAA